MIKKPATPTEPEQDANAGAGGSYIVDPKTGRRTLVERTAPATPPATPPEPAVTDNTNTATAPSPARAPIAESQD